MEATRLANKPEIQNKIQSLLKPLELAISRDSITTREKHIEEIRKRIEICEAKEDEPSLIRYYDMLSKIYGLYRDNDTPQQQENNLQKVDAGTLQKIING